MRRLLQVAAGLAGLVALVVLVGYLLPPRHTATTSRGYPASPELVWTAITDVEVFDQWRSGVSDVVRLPDAEGLARWREVSRGGPMTIEVVEQDPPRRLVTRIADDDLPFGGTWTYTVEATDSGSTLTITEDGEVQNPVFRFVSRFILGHDATMEAYHDDLEVYLADAEAG